MAAGFPMLYGNGTRYSLIFNQYISRKIQMSIQIINQELVRNLEKERSLSLISQIRVKL
jgi:hypothetical protein